MTITESEGGNRPDFCKGHQEVPYVWSTEVGLGVHRARKEAGAQGFADYPQVTKDGVFLFY